MEFLVVGPGAMGCLFAARLQMAGHGVTLIDYRKERAALINERGIGVEGVTGQYRVRVPATTENISGIPDMALICVKANKTDQAAKDLNSWLPRETRVLTLQNGLGNVEILEEIYGRQRVLGGVTAEGATLLDVGQIRHAGQGETIIGPEGPAGEVASVFNTAGFNTRSVDDVNNLIWGKLIINVGINALTAITRLKNGRLPEIKGTKHIMAEAVQEALQVAQSKGISLPYPEPLERVIQVCQATAGNIASMLQDVLHERATEVAFINGAIVREGTALEIPTPVNRTLTHLVEAVQETYQQRVADP